MKKKIFIGLFVFVLAYSFQSDLYSANSQKKSELHQKVDTLMKDGNFKKAENIAKKAYLKDPKNTEAICAYACVIRNKAYKSGIHVDSSALGIKEGKDATVAITSDKLKEAFKESYYYDQKLFAKAEKLYLEIINLDKHHIDTYYNLLNAYIVMNNYEKYFKTIKLFIKNYKDKKECKEILINFASKLYQKNELNNAEKLYKIILQEYPDYTYAKSDLASINLLNGRIKKAIKAYEEVYSKDPKDMINTTNLYRAYLIQQQNKKAFNLVKSITKIKKDKYFYNLDAAIIALLLNKDEDANKYFNSFIKIRKTKVKNTEKDFFLLFVTKCLNRKKLKKEEMAEHLEYVAIQHFENNYSYDALLTAQLILKYKTTSNALIILTALYDNSFNYPLKSLFYLHKINMYKKTDPKIMSSFDINSNYGRHYYLLKKYKKAIEYFNLALKENKKSAKVLYFTGLTYLAMNQKDKAATYFISCGKLSNKKEMYYINQSIRKAAALGLYKSK